MKIRSGFVANSSSSSFIISVPKTLKKVKVVLELDLNDTCSEIIKTQKEAKKYAEDNYISKESLNRILEELKNEKIVYEICASNDSDKPISQVLYNYEGSESKVIKDPEVTILNLEYE